MLSKIENGVTSASLTTLQRLSKALGVPVYELLGGKQRDRVPAYANGWYRTERTPEHFVAAAEPVVAMGFNALKLDPFGTAQGFIEDDELSLAAVKDKEKKEDLNLDFTIEHYLTK